MVGRSYAALAGGACRHATSSQGSTRRTPIIASVRAASSTKRPTPDTFLVKPPRPPLQHSSPRTNSSASHAASFALYALTARGLKWGEGRVYTAFVFHHNLAADQTNPICGRQVRVQHVPQAGHTRKAQRRSQAVHSHHVHLPWVAEPAPQLKRLSILQS